MAEILQDYAVEIRYPDDWFEPTLNEATAAFKIAAKIKEFVMRNIVSGNSSSL